MKGGKKVEEETKKPCTPVEEAGRDYNELGLYLHSKENNRTLEAAQTLWEFLPGWMAARKMAVYQYGGWVPLTDMVQMTTIDNNVVQATSVLASQSGRTMDTIVRDILCGGTNVIYAPKIGTGGAETPVTSRAGLDATAQLTVDLIDQAVAQLKVQNADPIGSAGGSYVAIIHPYAAYDIKKDPNWVEAHKYASPEEIFEGEIGKINNVRFVETSEAKIWTGTGCPSGLAVFGTLVLGAHAYATTELEGGGLQHIVKQLGYGDDPLNQRASVGWKGMRAAERLVEQYMVRIESVSSYSATAAAN